MLDETMKNADDLYDASIKKLAARFDAPADGFLSVYHFYVLQPVVKFFGKTLTIHFEPDPAMFGSPNDAQQIEEFGDTLLNSLKNLFDGHDAGILIANQFCYSVFRASSGFVFFNSHASGPDGKQDENGAACIWTEVLRFWKKSSS